jgi:hypothetical protein
LAGSPGWRPRRGFARSTEHSPAAPEAADAQAAAPARPRQPSKLARELASILEQSVRLAIIVVEAIIALRIVLRVLGADPLAPFTRFMYGVSGGLVSPFRGGSGTGDHPVFADPVLNGHPFELSSLLAMGVYLLLAYLLVVVGRAAGRALRAGFSSRS